MRTRMPGRKSLAAMLGKSVTRSLEWTRTSGGMESLCQAPRHRVSGARLVWRRRLADQVEVASAVLPQTFFNTRVICQYMYMGRFDAITATSQSASRSSTTARKARLAKSQCTRYRNRRRDAPFGRCPPSGREPHPGCAPAPGDRFRQRRLPPPSGTATFPAKPWLGPDATTSRGRVRTALASPRSGRSRRRVSANAAR